MSDSDDPKPLVEFRPQFAPHVSGRFAERTFDHRGLPNSQLWTAYCERCGDAKQGSCDSGQVRQHIQRFAMVHLHKDPLDAPRVVAPGSRRIKSEDP